MFERKSGHLLYSLVDQLWVNARGIPSLRCEKSRSWWITRSSASSMPFEARIREMSRPSLGTSPSAWGSHSSTSSLGALTTVIVDTVWLRKEKLCTQWGVQLIHSLDGIKYIYMETPCTKEVDRTQETRFSKSHSSVVHTRHQDHVGETRAPGRFIFLGITTISTDPKRIHRHKRTEIKKSDSVPESKSKSEPEEESEAIANR